MTRINEPTIPGILLDLFLAIMFMILRPMVWAMRKIGRVGVRLGGWKETR